MCIFCKVRLPYKTEETVKNAIRHISDAVEYGFVLIIPLAAIFLLFLCGCSRPSTISIERPEMALEATVSQGGSISITTPKCLLPSATEKTTETITVKEESKLLTVLKLINVPIHILGTVYDFTK